MPGYQLRFLRPDDTYEKVLDLEFSSDAEAKLFVIETYPQRPIEIWSGDRRVLRRASPRHDALLRGEFRSSCRYPTMSISEWMRIEAEHGPIPQRDFELVGRTSMDIYDFVGGHMRKHGVWFRALAHPRQPAGANQHARFSFHVTRSADGSWAGISVCTIWSPTSDGADVIVDLFEAATVALDAAHVMASVAEERTDTAKATIVRDGANLCCSTSSWWRLNQSGAEPSATS